MLGLLRGLLLPTSFLIPFIPLPWSLPYYFWGEGRSFPANVAPDNLVIRVNETSLREQRVVITKEEDFVDIFLLCHTPYKLLLVSTGHISNKKLERLFQDNLTEIVKTLEFCYFVALDLATLICHR